MYNAQTENLTGLGELAAPARTSLIRLFPGAWEIWSVLAGGITAAGIASFLANWAVTEQTQILSALSFAGALVWIYGILLADNGRKAMFRLGLLVSIMVFAASGNTDLLAASFLIHALAAAQLSSEVSLRQDKLALLGWTGATLAMAVITLIALV